MLGIDWESVGFSLAGCDLRVGDFGKAPQCFEERDSGTDLFPFRRILRCSVLN